MHLTYNNLEETTTSEHSDVCVSSQLAAARRSVKHRSISYQSYLVLELLCEALGLVQGKPRDQLRGEDMAAAQLVDHLRYVEEGVVLQQIPESDGRTKTRR